MEQHLGEIDRGWDTGLDGIRVPFQIALFKRPIAGGVPLATIGLSRYDLRSRVTGRSIRQELVFLGPEALVGGSIPAIMQELGQELISSRSALLRGDVVGPRGRIFDNYEMEAFYASVPIYFPEDFWSFGIGSDAVVMTWLFSITKKEAAFTANNGWSAFEEQLQFVDPDLVDPARSGVVP